MCCPIFQNPQRRMRYRSRPRWGRTSQRSVCLLCSSLIWGTSLRGVISDLSLHLDLSPWSRAASAGLGVVNPRGTSLIRLGEVGEMFIGFSMLLYWREWGLWESQMHVSLPVRLFLLTFEELGNFSAVWQARDLEGNGFLKSSVRIAGQVKKRLFHRLSWEKTHSMNSHLGCKNKQNLLWCFP